MAIAHSHISINSPDLPHTADHHSGVPPLVGQLPVVATSRDLRAETARRSSGEDDPNPVATGQGGNSESMKRELAVAVLDDSQLGQVRGGIDSGSGVELNFAFQQSTVINNDVVQNVILPTITVAGNGTTASVAGSTISDASRPAGSGFNAPSFLGTGRTAPADIATSAITPGMIVNNGQVLQTNPLASSTPNGITVMSAFGTAGLTNLVANTANNQLVQQMTTINVGVSGLQQLLQQGVPTSVIDQLNMTNALHH